jgi:hypothetical protein
MFAFDHVLWCREIWTPVGCNGVTTPPSTTPGVRMGTTVAAIVTVIVLLIWHLRTRRHPSWQVSGDGRFYIGCGYAMVALAVYWLAGSPTSTGWEWALGNGWALAAMVSFVYGFNALDGASRQRQSAAEAIELIPGGTEDWARAPKTQH